MIYRLDGWKCRFWIGRFLWPTPQNWQTLEESARLFHNTLCTLRTEVRGNFNIHGTNIFWDAVFHDKSKIYDVLGILNLWLRFLPPFLIKKKNFEKKFWKKKKSRKFFDFEFLNFFFVPMGSGVSGIDTSNNWRLLGF